MKRYKYFVSYHYENEQGTGHGNATIITNYAIDSGERIREVEKELSKEGNFTQMVLMNYIRMAEER